MKMKAMILAAGLGTRLKPVTDYIPKALVEVKGITLLELTLNRLSHFGVNDVIINVHHHHVQITDFLSGNKNFGMNITISDESGELLDTGGGTRKAAWFLKNSNPFIVHNVDVMSDLNFEKMVRFHLEHRAMATLAVRARVTERYLLFDRHMQMCGWKNIHSREEHISRAAEEIYPFAFSGIQVLDPAIFDHMQEKGPFSMTRKYIELAALHNIRGYRHDDGFWVDVGRLETLERLNR